MTRLFETNQLLKITGVPLATHKRWLAKRYVPREDTGGGRGRPNKFTEAAALWEMVLRVLFGLWPTAEKGSGATMVRVYLYAFGQTEGEAYEGPLGLGNGNRIVKYLDENQDKDDRRKFGFGVILLSGQLGTIGRLTPDRFVDVRIDPLDRVLRLTKEYLFLTPAYVLTSKGDGVASSLSIVNVNQLHRQIESNI